MLHPEVQGALIGVIALGVGWLVAKLVGYVRMYIDLKILKCKPSGNGYCKEHYKVMKVLTDLEKIHEEEVTVDRIVKAIKKANGG
jgi:hypothetical protein